MSTPSHSEDLSPAFPGTFPSLELKNKETKKSLPNPEPLSFLGCLLNYKYFSHNQEHTDEQTKKQHTHKHTCFLPLIKYVWLPSFSWFLSWFYAQVLTQGLFSIHLLLKMSFNLNNVFT
ncbi:hypothetical protein QOT17_025312 [Balamuthia mandrillaris]